MYYGRTEQQFLDVLSSVSRGERTKWEAAMLLIVGFGFSPAAAVFAIWDVEMWGQSSEVQQRARRFLRAQKHLEEAQRAEFAMICDSPASVQLICWC